uniref:Non-lysosomal glucosylceramidase n=1 Tax=Panagrolaimus superbus TaxID=310955 RepID=A0A914Z6B5_9BILA
MVKEDTQLPSSDIFSSPTSSFNSDHLNSPISPTTSSMTCKQRTKELKKIKRIPIKGPNISPNEEGLGGEYGWIARGDREPEEKRVPFTKPTVKQVVSAIPFIFRYSVFWLKYLRQKEKLFINTFQPLKHRPYYGVPCGGIGAGSIGRDFRGAFCKFSLRPGFVEQRVNAVKGNQFILNLSRNGKTIKQTVLSCAYNSGEAPLSSWDFTFPSENVAYRGLYPRSWTKYDLPEYGITVICRQITPIIPNNYKDSSLPTTVFVFEIMNNSDEAYDATITFTWRSGTGKRRFSDEGECQTAKFQNEHICGALLDHTIDKMQCIYAISALETDENQATICTGFNPNGNGSNFWMQLFENQGKLNNGKIEADNSSSAIATSLTTHLKPKQKRDLEFSLIWHMPIVTFGTKQRNFKRWYTRFFGTDPDGVKAIAEHALKNYKKWEESIDEWQNSILQHPNLPNWFKSALFNELYFLSDGGSVWFDFDENWSDQEKQLSEYTKKLLKEYGRFGYLESWEYRMYNTYDVHFYASFALAELFPKLEHVLQAEMSDNIHNSEEKLIKYHMEGDIAPQKTACRVPHDLGNPACEPWLLTNAYVMHDTALWKDLNLKYVLTSYRDYYCMLKKDKVFLEFAWPSVKALIEEGLTNWDRDGDGMIENFGLADQTYDAWRMVGVSAYCGSLWLAALKVSTEMAKDLEDTVALEKYSKILEAAKKVFEEKLWNGKYYNFDESNISRKTVMADQLCGYWYLQSINPELAKDLLPAEHVHSSLSYIYEYNVMKFGNGRLGVVNGMRPDGKVDKAYIQADEIWTGISYAIGAFFIQQGNPQKGFDVAWGIYDTCFNRSGLQYQTPEALYRKKYYRAIGYMRPLSIWSMYAALRKKYKLLENDPSTLAGIRITDPIIKDISNISSLEDASSDSEIIDIPNTISELVIADSSNVQTLPSSIIL